MDWSSYFSAPNNIHSEMPANMADGRVWSSWQPEAAVNAKIQQQEGIKSNWEYRQYLQKNANHIMTYNTNEAIYASGNNPYATVNTEPLSNTPYLYASYTDNTNPKFGYSNSDLKRSYLAKEQTMARMISPSVTL